MTTQTEGSPIHALVADDDEGSRRALVRALAAIWPGLRQHQAVDGIEAWDGFLEHEPALCFLDVRMPGLTGIEVAQRIGDRAPVVFVMAPNDRALPTFQADGVPHLLKPLDAARLAEVVVGLQQRLAPGHRAQLPSLDRLLDRLAGQLRRPAPLEVVETVEGSQAARLLRVDDVIYFEADARCTRAVSRDGEALIRTPLKELAAQLDPLRFRQIHRFVVVNERHISHTERLDEQTMVLSLRDRPRTLPVARHFQPQFLAAARVPATGDA
ncbi:LytTR family DNA-binding domain-containing protein [Piscinibacter sakaiensis]|uniref:DNA-binding response regulator, LytR family n=1 Tax=Piscinibacter sakaiensis TaxID=1547922 RepID=A0A0K8P8U5_PISS1|nr:LytTR family DNA-binding domain-containing protein [Piscinibacter sakaiensis]GAP38610.1 DNA-binding response regulator, LytR family [Piscinibacter sakaiensis]